MATTFEVCPGKVFAFRTGSSGAPGVGFYAVNPALGVGGDSRAFVIGLPFNYAEILQPVVSLDDKRLIYTFGSGWAEGSLVILLLLGDKSGQAVNQAISWYETNRISAKKGPIQVSVGGSGREAFVTGMRMGATDTQFHTQQIEILTVMALDQ